MTKKIYFEPAGRIHSTQREMMNYPPEGYEFVTRQAAWDRGIKPVIASDFAMLTLQFKVLNKFMPVHLTKAWLEGVFKRKPPEADLTYAYNHIVFRKEPWVVHVEWAPMLAGFKLWHLKRFKKVVEKRLASEYCKKILTWCETAKKSILLNLDCSTFEHKVEVLPLAVGKKEFTKSYDDDKVKLLFIGSANENMEFDFHFKGGKEALQAFAVLNERYDNLELLIRSDVPESIRKECQDYPNVRLIEEILPRDMMEHEFKAADILLFPGHHTPWGLLLDAMSYELPIIAIEGYANSEIVTDGVTGYVIKNSDKVPYWVENFIPASFTPLNSQRMKAIQTLQTSVVEELVEKASILIENKELRRRIGRAGRQEVEKGKFSVENRNNKLKTIFDEATA